MLAKGLADPFDAAGCRIDRESGDVVAVLGGVGEIDRFVRLRSDIGYGPAMIAMFEQNRGGDGFHIGGGEAFVRHIGEQGEI